MSTIFDDDDELAIKRIADEAEAGNYIEAFWLMVTESERYAALAQDMEKALHLASIFDVMDMVQGVLRETYDPKNLKAFTIAEVIGHIEGNLEVLMAQHPELAESVAVEQASPAEIGLAAGEEIRELIQSGKVKDESELASQFDRLAYEYGMQYIHIDDTRLPHVLKYRINPSFEIQLSGSNAVEMRSEGTGSGSNKTRVQWNPTKLNLTTTTNPSTNSYTVGSHMRAFPLSQDHAAGSVAGADTDHVGMMTNLPSASNRAMSGSGSGPYYYIRGHLLNDNLGGIANEVNLFPITHEANGQHKSFVEQYIKNGIAQGYVYRYEVAITNVKVGDEPSHGGYYVDSDLEFSFARLDSAQKDVTGTAHTGKIQSRYKTTGADPFDKSTEYATDYGGSYNHPVTVGSEEIHKPGEVAPVSSNAGLTGHVSTFTVTAPLGSNILGGASQSIDSNASLVPTGQLLSLNKSTKSKVVTYFDKLVKGWNTTSVDSWITDVRANSYTKWDDVFNSATTSFGLDAAVATKVRQGYLTRVSINGKANGT
ncbi:hypothetical protein [Dyella sp.]|uniref:hypothetical protein n=1 Tax=Dyella sp. TaxID=1869338 RepID=UPI002ED1C3FF